MAVRLRCRSFAAAPEASDYGPYGRVSEVRRLVAIPRALLQRGTAADLARHLAGASDGGFASLSVGGFALLPREQILGVLRDDDEVVVSPCGVRAKALEVLDVPVPISVP